MKLPQPLIESRFFQFESASELLLALANEVPPSEIAEINRLSNLNLPPISSREALAAMLGINSGLIWSIEENPKRYYRYFPIKKGGGERHIYAPKVALKVIHKWLAHHFSQYYKPPGHVFGFIAGRSHLQAASQHCGANWIFSVDIRDFFPSTSVKQVENTFETMGYNTTSSALLAKLCCLDGGLTQGAPTSPSISNLAFVSVDRKLEELAAEYGTNLSRYADDIVFSGSGDFPATLPDRVGDLFHDLNWKLAPEKTEVSKLPNRLKVHGLLVHGDHIRLTKGYRNRIRAYSHLLAKGQIREDDLLRVKGHLRYAAQVIKNQTD